uniref:Transposon Ty3-I Gag-Pol polyprotein n=1 Tax=Cajanus cajan TaxID=3821 RepID=A0A151T3Z1_CAJCA|nr:hypothetical protein KK1_016273 [Cajanus cajan]
MLDLGASINVMPLSIFKSLSLGPLQPTGVVIQLAHRSVAHTTGFVEDILVRVGELILPADFYVLDMEEGFSHGSIPIILGRPFSKIARTKIDVFAGTLSMEFGDIIVHFNILDAMKFPYKAHFIFCVELIDEHIHDFDSSHAKTHSFLFYLYSCLSCIESKSESKFEFGCEFDYDEASEFEPLGVVPLGLDFIDSEFTNHVARSTKESNLQVEVQVEVQVAKPLLPSLVPSDVQPAPTPELKPLPENLKYAYLEDEERFPVIISTYLDVDQEDRLLHVLRKHKKAIGWTLEDISGISPSTCMQRILLEDGAKPMRQPHRRLNPVILDVVKKEVTKLLQDGIIYPIFDS